MEKDPRYPIGKFTAPVSVGDADIKQWISILEALPAMLRKKVEGLGEDQLETPYRDGGWTIRQVVHHIPDSHLNFYIRVKWALTEDNPVIKPYFEDRWAELPDSKTGDVSLALNLVDAVHAKLVVVLRALSPEDFERTYYHPENKATWPLKNVLALYAWHSRHHLAHIAEAKKKIS